jgi:hypothetical protein
MVADRAQTEECTELLDRLLSLKPHDHIVIERQREDIPPTARILRAWLGGGDVEWLKMPVDRFPRTARLNSANGPLSLRDCEPPSFRCDGGPAAMRDLYRFGDVLLVSKKALTCLAKLDPEGFESGAANVEGLADDSYFVVLPRRALDVIDLPRTTVSLRNYLLVTDPEVGEIFSRTARFPKGYTVRADIPASIHLILNTYNADILMSVELIECLSRCGASGVEAIRTERLW